MGSIYKQKGSQNFYIKYYRNGRAFRESSGSPKEGVAKRLLRLREGDIERGIPITPKVGRLRFEEAAEDLLIDYRVNGRRSLVVAERRIRKHLTPFFGGRRMVAITTADVNRFIAKRQADTIRVRKARTIRTKAGWVTEPEQRKSVSNGEINRELTLLKRAFNLAIQAAKLINKPYIPLLKERNVRTGFFERHQFDSLCRHLPEVLVRMLTVAYITGWRVPSEIQTLEWRQVDFVAGELRLDPNTTKNDDGRVFPMTAELRAVLEQQWAITQALAKTSGRICPWVFHRDGKPIKSFKKRWQTASFKAGCPGRIPHDFRRTAVRNLVRAGVPERVAMQLTGHKTRSVFERYNIVSPGDLREAAEKLDVAAGIVLGIVRPLAAAGEQVISVFTEEKLEAPPGFEPGMEVLQSGLPLTRTLRKQAQIARSQTHANLSQCAPVCGNGQQYAPNGIKNGITFDRLGPGRRGVGDCGRVADRERRTGVMDRQIQDTAGPEIAIVHVAAEEVRRAAPHALVGSEDRQWVYCRGAA